MMMQWAMDDKKTLPGLDGDCRRTPRSRIGGFSALVSPPPLGTQARPQGAV
jgi:hypothetical protein